MADEDRRIWAAYAKGVKRIGKKRGSAAKAVPAAHADRPTGSRIAPAFAALRRGLSGVTPVVKAARDAGSFDAAWQAPLDKSLERRLRAGDVAIGARLDLHGMTQREAHCALEDFLERQVAAGKRVLLVITGKGRMGGGVLRARLAGWLAASPCATHIRGVRSAAPKHGGAGAFYVLLGKRKDER